MRKVESGMVKEPACCHLALAPDWRATVPGPAPKRETLPFLSGYPESVLISVCLSRSPSLSIFLSPLSSLLSPLLSPSPSACLQSTPQIQTGPSRVPPSPKPVCHPDFQLLLPPTVFEVQASQFLAQSRASLTLTSSRIPGGLVKIPILA